MTHQTLSLKKILETVSSHLKLNARKCKTIRTEYAGNRERIAVNGEEVEDVGEFPYLGATVDK